MWKFLPIVSSFWSFFISLVICRICNISWILSVSCWLWQRRPKLNAKCNFISSFFFFSFSVRKDKSFIAPISRYCIHENLLFTHLSQHRDSQNMVSLSFYDGKIEFFFISFVDDDLFHFHIMNVIGFLNGTVVLMILLKGEQSKLQILQQYELQKSAFTVCKGNFGGVKGKEFLCVMFLDGSLKFFEYDAISQDCVLPGNRSIPTNFIYVPRTDCFIILAPNWDLECYRFGNILCKLLDISSQMLSLFRYLNLSESFERKFSPIWSLNVGEFILDMNSHQVSKSVS